MKRFILLLLTGILEFVAVVMICIIAFGFSWKIIIIVSLSFGVCVIIDLIMLHLWIKY